MEGRRLNIAISSLTDVKFDGQAPYDNLDSFINKCNTAMDMVPDEDAKNVLYLFIKNKIGGDADGRIGNRVINTWAELKNFLRQIYSTKKSYSQIQGELSKCVQGPAETATSFSRRLEIIYRQLVCSLDNTLTAAVKEGQIALIQSQALDTFLAGLREKLKIVVRAQKPESLEDAIAISIKEEQFFMTSDSNNKTSLTTRFCHICNINSHNTAICRFNTRDYPSEGRGLPPPTQIITCNFCKKNGHKISECRKRLNQNQNLSFSNRSYNTSHFNPRQPFQHNLPVASNFNNSRRAQYNTSFQSNQPRPNQSFYQHNQSRPNVNNIQPSFNQSNPYSNTQNSHTENAAREDAGHLN